MEGLSNVTVIIPCFNDGAYIMEAISSIVRQTVKAEKVIIVDDGSGLETLSILKNINIDNVEIIFQENKGVSNARNRGISLAKTKYILSLDADDYFEATFIEKAVQVLNDNPKIGVVGCYYSVFKNNKKAKEIIKTKGGTLKDFLVKNYGLGNSMFRKQCWSEVSGYDEKMVNGYEDWEFWISILGRNWGMYILDEVLFNYRKKESSRDSNAVKNFDFELRRYILFKHQQLYIDNFDFYAVQLLRENCNIRSGYNRLGDSIDTKIGKFILFPLRMLKKIVTFKF